MDVSTDRFADLGKVQSGHGCAAQPVQLCVSMSRKRATIECMHVDVYVNEGQ